MHTHMHTIVRGPLGRGAHGSLRVLDPLNEPGRVTLITRYGSKKIRQYLPAHIKAVQAAGLKVGR
jgi:3-deoxy-D-arabino-heptulosonate 7-phosphate (DAHP) synthase class II